MNAGDLGRAADIIRQGGVIAYATESSFGLGCDPFNRDAVRRILKFKSRPADTGLIIIAATVDQARVLASEIPDKVLATWPGAHTWLLTPADKTPFWIKGRHPRVALRIPAHVQARALCHMAGMAIVSTSANRHGQRPIKTYREACRRLGKQVDYILPGFIGKSKKPSQIQDAVTGDIVRS